ncbi:uncharacterized protein LOC133708530 isoform X2 [Rosa rugosa]|uniref:uncharacterized protein LOC133708530 isoform X2 n=1 Tax=Rosa rugosa TaxID=74645 RepID=UPI002B41355F|nr:uncharacterized protein LOC133708530 isoform X2 [Rosa rugosa]
MVVIMISSAPASHPITPSPSSTTTAVAAIRSSTATTPAHSQLPSPLSRLPLPPTLDHVLPIPDAAAGTTIPCQLARVRISDISPYDGAPTGPYVRAVEALSGSLMRHNAAVIELGADDAALLRCGVEASRLYFRSRAQLGAGKGSRGVYMYRAGRALEDWDSSPPCMADVFRCMGKVARVALSAIARHLRLRSDVFSHLLDDTPLPANEVSSSVLLAAYTNASLQNGKGAIGGGKPGINGEVEKGLLTLISSDSPGIQVCDPNGRWYLADSGSAPGDLLLLTGKALSHATAGLRPAASYKAAPDYSSGVNSGGRTSLAFRLMPQGNAILDCSPIAAAGHVIPQSYVPISVSQFMDDLSAEEDVLCNHSDSAFVPRINLNKDPSLRSVLSDPLSGAFLEDAMVVSCGHSFGGLMLRRVIESENGDVGDDGINRGVQYPFSVNEKVMIKGNRRTPEKFVGKEAVITSQCLNGWYLLKIIGSGENVRLQYRSLRKI